MEDQHEIAASLERFRFLDQVGQALTSLDYEVLLRRLPELMVPYLADWCAVFLVEEGMVYRIKTTFNDPSLAKVAAQLELQPKVQLSTLRHGVVGESLHQHKSFLVPAVDQDWIRRQAINAEHARLLLKIEARSQMVVPLIVKGEALGVVTFFRRGQSPSYTDLDLALAEEVVDRAANALEQARLLLLFQVELEERQRVELVLKQNEERYRSFVAQSTEGICRVELVEPIETRLSRDEQVRLLCQWAVVSECNDAFAKMYGFTSADAIKGRLWVEILEGLGEDVQNYLAAFVAAQYRLSGVEISLYQADNHRLYFGRSMVGTVWEQQLVQIWCTQADITARRLAELGLAEQTQLYQALLKVQSDVDEGVLIIDGLTEKIIYANEALQRITGYNVPELLAMSSVFEGLVLQDDWELLRLRMQQRLQGKVVPTHYEATIIHKEGQQVLIELAAKALMYRERPQVVIIARDITERHVALRQVQFQANLMENVSDAVLATDAQLRLTSWNRAAEQLYGWRAEEVLGQVSSGVIQPSYSDDREELIQLLATGQTWRGEMNQARADGSRVEVASSIAAIFDEPDEVVGYVAVNHDITERKRLEQQREEFLAIASHELKTPVTSAKAFTQLLERKLRANQDQEGLRFADRIDTQLNRLSTLIEELLDVSQIQTGQIQLNRERVDWTLLITETIEEMEEALDKHRVVVERKRPIWIMADRPRLVRVMQNLLANAAKYSAPGSEIVIRLGQRHRQAWVSVQDFGQGIRSEDLPHIFERFWRSRVINQERGLGLGLYICAEIIQSHGGRLTVQSTLGEGTTFRCNLPLAEVAVD